MSESTPVVIIGAGPAGLTLANLLQRDGIGCVVLEARTREYVEQRQRAGVLDHYGGKIFADAGLGPAVLDGVPLEAQLEFRLDGVPRLFDVPAWSGDRASHVVPQQLLVRRLIAAFLDGGGDLRFSCADVAVDGTEVTYAGGALTGSYVAGCDGFHGVSRASIPSSAAQTYTFDHGIGWYTLMADVPPPRHATLAISRHGFAAAFARGPRSSRFYLQYLPGQDPRTWSDEHAWEQLRLRLGDPALPTGEFTSREVVEMRSFVIEPMAYGRMFLAGDAAHVITPMGAKGMNLAVADAATLAKALSAALTGGGTALLDAYSATCLRRTWDYQEWSRWFTEMVHDAGDEATSGAFRRKLALARFERLFSSPPAATAFADMMAGSTH